MASSQVIVIFFSLLDFDLLQIVQELRFFRFFCCQVDVEVERSDAELKHLEFLKILGVHGVVVVSNLYENAKQNSGPLKSTVETVENVVTAVVDPVYQKVKGVPGDLLVFLDKKVFGFFPKKYFSFFFCFIVFAGFGFYILLLTLSFRTQFCNQDDIMFMIVISRFDSKSFEDDQSY